MLAETVIATWPGLGRGATVRVILPVVNDEPPQPTPPRESSAREDEGRGGGSPGGKETVLVAEDGWNVLELKATDNSGNEATVRRRVFVETL